MTEVFDDEPQIEQFDQLSLERSVRSLCKVGIRRSPLTLERVKAWVNQFDGDVEKCLAWLILRHLIYRTGPQLESSLRQAIKKAATHFLRLSTASKDADWREALAGNIQGLKFYCGPPTVSEYTLPGKSGEVITRLVNRKYKIDKWYPSNVTTLDPDDRFLVVDDGAYTGQQLIEFLDSWQYNYSDCKVAIVVGIAHQRAVDALRERYPTVPLFFGELLTEKNSLQCLSDRWIADRQWPHTESTPRDVYLDICFRKGQFSKPLSEGFGSLGLIVGFEHGIPDDSLQLIWDKSLNWTPLIER